MRQERVQLGDVPNLTQIREAIRVIKRPIVVAAQFAIADGLCQTLEGPVSFRAGDPVLTGVKGERWPVRRPNFLASYSPVPPTEPGQDGNYIKNPSVTLALQLDRALQVPVGWKNEPLQGRPGDWLLRYEDGSHAVISDAIFRETYEAADQDDRGRKGVPIRPSTACP